MGREITDVIKSGVPRLGRRLLLNSGGAALSIFTLAGCARSQPNRFENVDVLVREAVRQKQTPGVVLAVGHNGRIVHRYVYGRRALVPEPEVMTWETRFDMASLTKPTMTAVAIMQLVEQGKVNIDDPVTLYLPDFAANGKAGITLRLLLTHYSGLPPDLPLDRPWEGKKEAVRLAMNSPLGSSPGDRFVYSDINYIVIGLIVEKVSGQSLDGYVTQNILAPLGMKQSGYVPSEVERPLIAPTEYDEHGAVLRGVVHDPTARRMGGVAGHAGLFSDAADMCVYAQALLDRLAGRSSPFPLSQKSVQFMVSPQQPAGKADLRGIGWDIATHYSSPRGDVFPAGESFGHTGFTGTSLWCDPQSDSFVLMLTNRVHPVGKGHSIVQLRHDVATESALALGLVRKS